MNPKLRLHATTPEPVADFFGKLAPYVKSRKNDANDAEGPCEPAGRSHRDGFWQHPFVDIVDLVNAQSTRIRAMSATMPYVAQKSSISCVSGMPPIIEPAIDRRLAISLNALDKGCGAASTPPSVPPGSSGVGKLQMPAMPSE